MLTEIEFNDKFYDLLDMHKLDNKPTSCPSTNGRHNEEKIKLIIKFIAELELFDKDTFINCTNKTARAKTGICLCQYPYWKPGKDSARIDFALTSHRIPSGIAVEVKSQNSKGTAIEKEIAASISVVKYHWDQIDKLNLPLDNFYHEFDITHPETGRRLFLHHAIVLIGNEIPHDEIQNQYELLKHSQFSKTLLTIIKSNYDFYKFLVGNYSINDQHNSMLSRPLSVVLDDGTDMNSIFKF